MMMIQTHYCIAQHFFDTSMRLQIADCSNDNTCVSRLLIMYCESMLLLKYVRTSSTTGQSLLLTTNAYVILSRWLART